MTDHAPHHPPHNPFSPNKLKRLSTDKKFVETVKIFAIYGTIASVAGFIVDHFVFSLMWGGYVYPRFNFFGLIPVVISTAIGSAVAGAAFFFFYEPVRNWIKKNAFVSKYIHSIFTLFWVPTLLVTIINAISELTRPFGIWGMGLTAILVTLICHLAIYYFYAASVSKKVAPHYSW